MNIDLCDAPSTPPYFHLIAGHRFDMDSQRNILLHFIDQKGLNDEFVKFLDKHLPDEQRE